MLSTPALWRFFFYHTLLQLNDTSDLTTCDTFDLLTQSRFYTASFIISQLEGGLIVCFKMFPFQQYDCSNAKYRGASGKVMGLLVSLKDIHN